MAGLGRATFIATSNRTRAVPTAPTRPEPDRPQTIEGRAILAQTGAPVDTFDVPEGEFDSRHLHKFIWDRGGQSGTTVPAHSVLVVDGVPPKMKLTDAAGREVGTFSLTQSNRASFETALKRALAAFLGTDATVMGARLVFIRNAAELAAAVRGGKFAHLIYYGHALTGENVLLPSAGQRITAPQLAQALAGTAVSHFDILGCRSMSIAGSATCAPRVKTTSRRI